MRGQRSPSPIYEGEDGLIAWLLGGPKAAYVVSLPAPGEPKRAILEPYTKELSAEYQAQALIDLARRLNPRITDTAEIERIVIHASHHTHHLIGSGSRDPQKYDPAASRETLDQFRCPDLYADRRFSLAPRLDRPHRPEVCRQQPHPALGGLHRPCRTIPDRLSRLPRIINCVPCAGRTIGR
jgi:hypothetical protein